MSAEKLLAVAAGELGYLEKASGEGLWDKTANPGQANYTKYGAWFQNGALQAQPWCDIFVSWCAHMAGEEAALGQFAYVPSHVDFFRRRGSYFARGEKTPRPGDVIFFREGCHVGLVEQVSGGWVTTIEGNTAQETALVSNGGAVCRKRYRESSMYIMGYGRPAYGGGSPDDSGEEMFVTVKVYQNGSTPEPVFADTGLGVRVGTLNPWEKCDCLGVLDGRYIVRYPVDGTDLHKVGVVAYNGVE